ncbi:MAG: hypothetical protein J4203_02450 [Candidatus Diapherotrites archaeon]|uniref:Uncharacterized protein n=1 Tax=Candidatus Iainarchaeum sp. TaxID=3101447 RepID=A0A8T4LII8_9ARCH|nr:hypothetical protein [Candidatus Diapherotrites archaeon]
MPLASKLFKLFFLVAVILVVIGLALPTLKEQLSIQGNSVDVKLRVPFTTQALELNKVPVDATTQQDALFVGSGLLAILVLWKFISLNPLHLLTDMRKKKEIHSELRKMDSTLEEIKRLGQGFD